LGGYATGTLTPEERQAFFEAALDNQELFEALAKEQPLHDLLHDPAARAQVLAAIEDKPRPWWQFANRWMLAGATAAACLAIAVGIYFSRPKPAAKQVLVAVLQDQPFVQPVAPPAEPLNRVTPSVPPAAPPAEPLKKVPTPALQPAGPPAEALKQLTSPAPPAPADTAKPRDLEEQRPARRQDETVLRAETSAPKPMKASAGFAGSGLAPRAAAPLAAPTPPVAPTSTQTVEVTASNSVLDASKSDLVANGSTLPLTDQNARALFYNAQGLAGTQFLPSPQQAQMQSGAQRGVIGGMAGALLVPNPGVKWTVLRKQPNGLFDQVSPDQIKAGDTIKLRLVPNDDGFLSVFDAGNPLVSNALAKRLEPLETPEITSRAGKKDLTVLLARQAQPVQLAKDAKKQEKTAGLFRTVATDQLTETDRSERAVYEVKTGNNPFAPILLKITLNFQ
jgi:hypothetical protein